MDPPATTPTAKAIGSLAKKQSDVSRQGPSKLKFVPTLPQRRKKEDVKPEPAPAAAPPPSERGRGRGRGRGDARGRGRGRGAAPPVQMTASGPFAMGPAMAGSSGARRAAPRSNFVPVPSDAAAVAAGAAGALSQSAPPALRKDAVGAARTVKAEEDEEEVYSDADEGVEIVDMENVRQMDWMAPESLRKERHPTRTHKPKVKKEEGEAGYAAVDAVDEKNALNLSESEEEEELEDIIEDFATQNTIATDGEPTHEDRLYFFQFPAPFPKFRYKNDASITATAMDVDSVPAGPPKKVSFAPDVKPDIASVASGSGASGSRTPSIVPSEPEPAQPLDGVIGQLEVYRSGAVKIRLANGILLDVSAATQPSFLQQAVVLDSQTKQLCVLGEVNKQFVVSPNVDALLSALEADEASPADLELEEGLIRME
ncbi:RNA polymerase III RPC4-domain-containing protein [Pholiota molesta]|nr:RNA polymerase III RPC4-domain-containing protein [Pholiota molesta]